MQYKKRNNIIEQKYVTLILKKIQKMLNFMSLVTFDREQYKCGSKINNSRG